MARDGAGAAPVRHVAIAGAGPAGCMAAIRLARAGVRATIIDPCRERPRFGETLSPEARQELFQTGLWGNVPQDVVRPCDTIRAVWASDAMVSQSFLTNPYGHPWHVDRARFDRWLQLEASRAGAELVEDIALKLCATGTGWEIVLEKAASRLRADFLIIAGGRACRLTRQLGKVSHLDSLCAIGGEARGRSGDSGLLVEAVREGWWYSAPTPSGTLFVALLTDRETRPRRMAWSDLASYMETSAKNTFHRCNGPFRFTKALSAYSSELQPSGGPMWIAIGDAAIARDPLSGEGIAYALKTGRMGADIVLNGVGGSSWNAQCNVEAARVRTAFVHAYKTQQRWPGAPFWHRRHLAIQGLIT